MRKWVYIALGIILLLFFVASCDTQKIIGEIEDQLFPSGEDNYFLASNEEAEHYIPIINDLELPEELSSTFETEEEEAEFKAQFFRRMTQAEEEYIVGFEEDFALDQRLALYSEYSPIQHIKSFELINADLVRIDEENMDLLMSLEQNSFVKYIEPNYLYEDFISNDEYINNLWGLKNYGQTINNTVGIPSIDINMEQAWNKAKGSSDIIVAVIDTGVDINHPDLKANMINGWNFYDDNDIVYTHPYVDSHGTHVAGTIAAVSNNSEGVAGIAPNVKIMPLKFLGPFGGYTADAITAIEYASKNGAVISNNSWGGSEYSEALREAIRNSGILFVAAAGNDSQNADQYPLYPAAYDLPNVISVASINNRGQLSYFSTYGQHSVHVAAPGEQIFSTIPEGMYSFYSGTSMAAPHVSGVAALIASQGITDPVEIKKRILDSAYKNPLTTLQGRTVTGGLVEAYIALGGNPPEARPEPDPEPAPEPEPEPAPEPAPVPPAPPRPEPDPVPPVPDDDPRPKPNPEPPYKPVEDIILEEDNITVYVGDSYQVNAVAYPDPNAPLFYNMSSSAARVTESGKIIAHPQKLSWTGEDTYLIIKAESGVFKKVPIKIRHEYVPVDDISIDTYYHTLVDRYSICNNADYNIIQWKITLWPSHATNKNYWIEVEDPSIVTFDEYNTPIPHKNGKTKVFVYSECMMQNPYAPTNPFSTKGATFEVRITNDRVWANYEEYLQDKEKFLRKRGMWKEGD